MARILLVDDEVIVLQMLAEVLQLDYHDVTSASDGNSALSALATGAFDLVVTDIVMPDKEGLETIIEMRKLKPDLPIIAMSGGGRGSATDYLEMAVLLGAKRALTKPFPMQELLKAVREVLAS